MGQFADSSDQKQRWGSWWDDDLLKEVMGIPEPLPHSVPTAQSFDVVSAHLWTLSADEGETFTDRLRRDVTPNTDPVILSVGDSGEV